MSIPQEKESLTLEKDEVEAKFGPWMMVQRKTKRVVGKACQREGQRV